MIIYLNTIEKKGRTFYQQYKHRFVFHFLCFSSKITFQESSYHLLSFLCKYLIIILPSTQVFCILKSLLSVPLLKQASISSDEVTVRESQLSGRDSLNTWGILNLSLASYTPEEYCIHQIQQISGSGSMLSRLILCISLAIPALLQSLH